MSRAALLLLPALALVAACDHPVTSAGPATPENPALTVQCLASIAAQSVRCGAPGAGAASAGLLVGGQGTYVRLASSGVVARDGDFAFDVTVQNLLPQAMGTSDGRTRDPDGIRVFFAGAPAAAPAGVASVANPDGEGTFTGSGQPYFQYDTVLRPGEVSAPRRWRLAYSPGVEQILFTVYVSAPVPHQGDWLDVDEGQRFVLPGDTLRIGAAIRDPLGRPRQGRITYSSSDERIVTVDSTGLVRGQSYLAGVHVTVSSEHGTVHVPVAVVTEETGVRIEVSPGALELDMGETAQLTARVYNVRGEPVDAPVGWTEIDQHVAVVDQTGLVRGTYPGSTRVSVWADWATTTVAVTTRPGPDVRWSSVSTAQDHTCGVTTDGRGFCWGRNTVGQLGIGMYNQFRENVPVAVDRDAPFLVVDGGMNYACGLDTGGAAYCWGYPEHGKLGLGWAYGGDPVVSPAPVVGGHRFRAISAGFNHTCAVDVDGAAWCWGNNTYGQLGNGTRSVPVGEGSPVAVVGGHTFRAITATRDFTCAITTADRLYCWGDNEVGQLGDGSAAPGVMISEPVEVAGGHRWTAVAASDSHACGITTAGAAYCWGQDQFGELGRGTAGASSNVPAPVASALTFTAIGVGSLHSCAIATGGTAYCWGYDQDGQLGRGNKDGIGPNPTPQPVLGDVRFAGSIQGGFGHTCAVTVDGDAYCWGADFDGQAGVQPDVEYCSVPGGQAPCQTRPRPVANPAAGGGRTGPVPDTSG